jgi:hypothetical protein
MLKSSGDMVILIWQTTRQASITMAFISRAKAVGLLAQKEGWRIGGHIASSPPTRRHRISDDQLADSRENRKRRRAEAIRKQQLKGS